MSQATPDAGGQADARDELVDDASGIRVLLQEHLAAFKRDQQATNDELARLQPAIDRADEQGQQVDPTTKARIDALQEAYRVAVDAIEKIETELAGGNDVSSAGPTPPAQQQDGGGEHGGHGSVE